MTPPTQEPRRLSADELAAIRERCERATPGPWTNGGMADVSITFDHECNIFPPDTMATHGFQFDGPVAVVQANGEAEDATFIARARSDVPALIGTVAALEAQLAQAKTLGAVEALEQMLVLNEKYWVPDPTVFGDGVNAQVQSIRERLQVFIFHLQKAVPTNGGQDA